MKRLKRHKIKQEMPESSTTRFRDQEEHDLAHYIHDRVELMHQVFSVIKPKELKSMAPECVQHISIDDLQELCTEELLGISSKRLCSILDGADPPTDTESSTSEHMETISLDSISSDDEILSQPTSKKKHKHRKHKSKNKHKRKNSEESAQENREYEDRSKASRAGLTVLELLELQARARAIRAQLQQDNANVQTKRKQTDTKPNDDTEDEVEIKEEPAEVVEISSEDEKPNIKDLPVKPPSPSKDEASMNSKAVTKRINNFIVTVPQSKPSKKIKLNRNKTVTISSCNSGDSSKVVSSSENVNKNTNITQEVTKISEIKNNNKEVSKTISNKTKQKKKQRKKSKKSEKDGSDHDEITLQLSDTEKMDLLEDFDRKNYENFTSSSEDSESSSETDSESDKSKTYTTKTKQSDQVTVNNKENSVPTVEENKALEKDISTLCDEVKTTSTHYDKDEILAGTKVIETDKENKIDANITESLLTSTTNENVESKIDSASAIDLNTIEVDSCDTIEVSNTLSPENESNFKIISTVTQDETQKTVKDPVEVNKSGNDSNKAEENFEKKQLASDSNEISNESIEEGEITSNVEENKGLSEGEITDREDEMQNDNTKQSVVCISDDEVDKRKKKKKKEKKSKKERKLKKSKSDFREGADQNFFEDSKNAERVEDQQSVINKEKQINTILTLDDDDIDDDIYEILELSDDSSCYEVEGISVSKKPTAAEIEALSAKIDEIHTENIIVINEDEPIDGNSEEKDISMEKIDNISWHDRYLGSKKVKRVLTTSNILNALRKRNKALKKKLEESKKKLEESKRNNEEVTEKDKIVLSEISDFVEGSIEHFNTLQGSTKYVDPLVPNEINADDEVGTEVEIKKVTKEMEKDAKQLLKMYKRLLKYNDMNKKKDSNKKKKKKHKKHKDKDMATQSK